MVLFHLSGSSFLGFIMMMIMSIMFYYSSVNILLFFLLSAAHHMSSHFGADHALVFFLVCHAMRGAILTQCVDQYTHPHRNNTIHEQKKIQKPNKTHTNETCVLFTYCVLHANANEICIFRNDRLLQ